MATSDLFGADEPLGDDSDDSFIADSGTESDGSLASQKPADDGLEADYEFLFGSESLADDTKKKKKSASKWQKELDRRLREANAQYADMDNIEQDIQYTISQLEAHFERRQGVETEMLTLFSGLLTREQFVVDAAPPPTDASCSQVTSAEVPPLSEVDRTMDKVMKKLIRQTFRGRIPEGRFGHLGRAPEEPGKVPAPSKINTVITVSQDALSNLQDLNTLLSREREGDYVELDGIPLYKHTRYGSLYIFESGLVTTHILPLCTKLMQEASTAENDYRALTQEVVYLLYQLSQPPSEAWYNYWTEAQPHYRALATSHEYDHDESVASELKRRSGIIGHYMHGLVSLRSALLSSDLWTLIGEFRLKLENFKRSGYRTAEQKQHVEMLQQRQTTLANERDALLADAQDSDDDSSEQATRGRLRKDQSAVEERKKRLQELRTQLYNVNEELANERQAHMEAEQQTRLHSKTIRLLITNVLTVPGDGLSLLCILQDSGLISLLREEVMSCFDQCKRGFSVSDSGDIAAHPAYISEGQREIIWEYLRLVHSMLVCIDIGRFLSTAYKGVRPAEMQLNDILIRSGEEPRLHTSDNDSLFDLIRINPKLARLRLRNPENFAKFVINERFGGTRTQQSYDHWFRFPTLTHLQTPFDISSGVFSRGNPAGHATSPLSITAVKSLQTELHRLIGIDVEFEHCYWSEATGEDAIYYELGLVLSLCFSDLFREAQDRYFQHTDYQVVLDLHAWVVTYYRCLYTYVREQCHMENKPSPPEAYVLLALRRYVGGDSLCAKVSCAYTWQLIRKHSLAKSSHLGATSALRALFADLNLLNMLHEVQENLPLMRICQETLSSYFSGDIRAILFWVLRNYKPLSHPANLFCFALSNLHLMRKVVQEIGSVTFTVEKIGSDSMAYDMDSDSSDDGLSSTKTIVVTADSIFSSHNRNKTNDDILYNGRVVYNCISMLANFRTNSAHLNDMLVSHLEVVPIPMLYDIKYFFVFRDITSDRNVWKSERWRWIGDFCMRILETFFDSWLGRGNRFLPLELLFNKSTAAVRGPFRPTAPENITPIMRGYEHCEMLNELLRRPDATVYEVAKELRGGSGGPGWDPEEDATLIKYYKQFHYMDDPIEYIAELLGTRASDVLRRLQELKVIGAEEETTRAASNFPLKQTLQKLVAKFGDLGIKSCAELHDNITEALNMQRLGGAEAVCEVMEPLSATTDVLESHEFKELITILGISKNWMLPKDTTSLVKHLTMLSDPNNYTDLVPGEGHSDNEAPDARNNVEATSSMSEDERLLEKDADKKMSVPSLVTSRDIAQLLIDLFGVLNEHTEMVSVADIIQDAMSLVASAAVLGNAESVCANLPQNEDCLNKLRALLVIADVEVAPPMLLCKHVANESLAVDRLHVALNLSRLSVERLEAIVQQQLQQFTKALRRQRGLDEEVDDPLDQHTYDDHLEEHLDLDAPINFATSRKASTKSNRNGTSRTSESKKSKKGFPKKDAYVDSSAHAQTLDATLPKAAVYDHELYPPMVELSRRLSNGDLRIDAAEIMCVGIFEDWESAFENLRSVCKSLGAVEDEKDDTLWLVWPTEVVDAALKKISANYGLGSTAGAKRGRKSGVTALAIGVHCEGDQNIDTSAFQRLEVDSGLVASLYEESLRLAREGRLKNTLGSKDDLKRLLE
ncbi:Pb-reticulocyte binding protein, putative [Babesia ovis]|uniref:Pb-reticulocyte binding protein, putative n=1 Tax=Babesia ovis TaxID=5869 RepID=A0A9W5TF25_BABOV|nr:Pb-reticulocyte binding protein, putative [Babesia ovis]